MPAEIDTANFGDCTSLKGGHHIYVPERLIHRAHALILAGAVLAGTVGFAIEAGPARATYPGDDGLILASARGEQQQGIAAIDPESGEIQMVMEAEPDETLSDPEWAPDGIRFTFHLYNHSDSSKTGYYIADADGSDVQPIPDSSKAYAVSWDPTGQKIATIIYTGHDDPTRDGDPMYDVTILDLSTEATNAFSVPLDRAKWDGGLSEIEWSPAGDRLAIQVWGRGEGDGFVGGLFHIGIDGTGLETVTETPREPFTFDWSPDGSRLVYEFGDFCGLGCGYERRGFAIYEMTTGTSTEIEVPEYSTDPMWSPTGERLAFVGYGDAAMPNVWTMKPDGSDLRQMTKFDGTAIYLDTLNGSMGLYSWQPDPGCILEPAPAGARPLLAEPSVTVGKWVAQGCLKKKGSTYTSKETVLLSGITLDPGPGVKIVIDTTAKRLTSTGPVSVALKGRAGGVGFGPQVHEGTLNWDLSSPKRTFDLGHFLHLPTQNDLVIEATSNGVAKGRVEVALPGIVGGRVVPADFALSNTIGLSPDISLPMTNRVNVTDLIALTNVQVKFNPALNNWGVDASFAGAPVDDIGFSYEEGSLTSARLSLPELELAGLVKLTDFTMRFNSSISDGKKRESYSIEASTTNGDESESVTGQVVYQGGDLDAFNISVQAARVFSVIKVKNLNLAWSNEDGWSGGANALFGWKSRVALAEMVLQLESRKHRLVGGSLSAPVVQIAGGDQGFRLESFRVSYALVDLPGGTREVWSGGADLRLPGPDSPTVAADLTFVDGDFEKGTIEGKNIYLGPGLKLKSIKAAIGVDPLLLEGSASVAVGPHIPLVGVADISGSVAFVQAVPPDRPADLYNFGGGLNLGNAKLLGANVQYMTNGYTSVTGDVSWAVGDLALVSGSISGVFENEKKGKPFRITGTAEVKIGPIKTSGRGMLNQQGIAGCLKIPDTQIEFGFGYLWRKQATKRFDGVCDMGEFLKPEATRQRLQSGATSVVTIPSGVEGTTLSLRGDGGAPEVTLRGPSGRTISTATDGFQDRAVVYTDGNVTYVAVGEPEPGDWSIEIAEGSVPVTEIKTAEALPDPTVEGSVAGTGEGRVLTYSTTNIEEREVRLVERWAEGETTLGVLDEANGSMEFSPSPGPAGERWIVAVITNDGLPVDEIEITTFTTELVPEPCTAADPCKTEIDLTLRTAKHLVASGAVTSARASGAVYVILERKKGEAWIEIAAKTVELSDKNTYRVSFRDAGERKRRVTALYLGSYTHSPSAVTNKVAGSGSSIF